MTKVSLVLTDCDDGSVNAAKDFHVDGPLQPDDTLYAKDMTVAQLALGIIEENLQNIIDLAHNQYKEFHSNTEGD